MSKINVLDSSVFNKIAAGEVVERPSSVVKELLDNSIDALSTRITVKITDGGIKNITVLDNGTGIEKDDFDKVFLAHATSKIKTENDLEKIGTLGFRGEALASISAVSKVTLLSKVATETYGAKLKICGGNKEEINDIGCSNGTTIEIEDLFYNVPARAKFLKKPKQEQTEITNLISRYILANPTISISYFADGEEIISSNGNGIKDALFVVYGKDILNNIVELDYINSNKIKVSGFIGKPTFTKPNRTYQTLIVNGRYVVNSMVSLCVFNAFERYLMKGQFPFYVINLSIPLDKLDVNVHPNKMDIRFENSNEIYGVVYNAISQALSKASTQVNQVNVGTYEKVSGGISFNDSSVEKTINLEGKSYINKEIPEVVIPSIQTTFPFVKNDNILKENDSLFKANLTMQELKTKTETFVQQSIFASNEVKFIGTIFTTYLIVEVSGNCYLIDQHAAHERLLFDKFKKQIDSKKIESQLLLIPFVLNVNHLEKEFLVNNLESVKSMGFDIEIFGNLSFKINSIPAILKNINLDWFFSLILGELSIFKTMKQSDLIIEKLMQHACKSAVKAGDILSASDVLELINQIKQEKMELQCPHGRPVIIELTKNEIEKWFKRTV